MLTNEFLYIREFLTSLSTNSMMLDDNQKLQCHRCILALEDIRSEYDLLNKQLLKAHKKLEKKRMI